VRHELRLSDPELARDAEQWLVSHEAARVSRREQLGILPIAPIVLAATVALPLLSALVMWVRSKTRCQVIVDARGEKVVSDVDCRVRDGRVIVLTAGDTKVQLTDIPELFDMTKVVSAALLGDASAVKAAATDAGAKVEL
jgi:hypothetical protein